MTNGLGRWPEHLNAGNNVHFSNSNLNHGPGFGEHGQVLPNLNTNVVNSSTSTPSTIDIDDRLDTPSEDESNGDDGLGSPVSLTYSFTGEEEYQTPPGPGPGQQQQHPQWQPQEEQMPFVPRRGANLEMPNNLSRHPHLGQVQHVPNLVTLTCAVCSSPTVQMCEGCSSIGYCSREHQLRDWFNHGKNCHAEARSSVDAMASHASSNVSSVQSENTTMDRYTLGKVFEVDAILIPVDNPLPRLVKAKFAVEVDEAQMKLRHHERSFDELLGEAAPWMDDGQWDEDARMPISMQTMPQPRMLGIGASEVVPTFSLHCRPNGVPNRCYETLANITNNANANPSFPPPMGSIMNQAAMMMQMRGPVPSNGHDANMQAQRHLRGNGSILVLKHPTGTLNPQRDGAPVLDATLADLKLVTPYLRQRLQQKKSPLLLSQAPSMPGMSGMGMGMAAPMRPPQPGLQQQVPAPGMGYASAFPTYQAPQQQFNNTSN
ncbi:hypothetical protein SCHPADRAFT_940137 [Schizopora paradoxa]|uniref:MYND-type domain-containing protein n=1 Tax=Schizopora paradoxa TaxID=27342 RepID=A0A0H2RPA5_9AGAM|nr:hypothetical protein SCHPADRAFT_940137 [Schizopora paradoxa]